MSAGPATSITSATAPANTGDRHEREVHAAAERVRVPRRRAHRAREVGKDRGLHRLEEPQRRAGDQQHVEREARPGPRPRSPSVALTSSGPAFRKVCSASMIAQHGDGEARCRGRG